MALRDITDPQAVVTAMAEYERIGQGQFLTKYGFNKATRYVISHDGKYYDSKAVLGAAHGYQFPAKGPLTARVATGHGLHGGKPTISKLRQLGFTVINLDTGREM